MSLVNINICDHPSHETRGAAVKAVVIVPGPTELRIVREPICSVINGRAADPPALLNATAYNLFMPRHPRVELTPGDVRGSIWFERTIALLDHNTSNI